MDEAIADYPDNISLYWVEPETVSEFGVYHTNFAEDGLYDLIICVGFLHNAALDLATETYPDQNWALIDAFLNKSNVRSYLFKEQEGSFLVVFFRDFSNHEPRSTCNFSRF